MLDKQEDTRAWPAIGTRTAQINGWEDVSWEEQGGDPIGAWQELQEGNDEERLARMKAEIIEGEGEVMEGGEVINTYGAEVTRRWNERYQKQEAPTKPGQEWGDMTPTRGRSRTPSFHTPQQGQVVTLGDQGDIGEGKVGQDGEGPNNSRKIHWKGRTNTKAQ